MFGEHFRPWGFLDWVLLRIPEYRWSVFGCLSTEDRCLATIQMVKRLKPQLTHVKFLHVQDPQSNYSSVTAELIKGQEERFLSLGMLPKDIERHELFEEIYKLKESIDTFITGSEGSIIIDFSSFPKRFFFPIIRLLIDSQNVRNLIATYTVPEKHSSQALAEDPEPWGHIPLFGPIGYPDRKVEVVIVGVGFLPFGLPELLKNEYENINVKYFVPFPPGPPPYHRTWEFLREIEKYTRLSSDQLRRINTYDVSDTFDNIYSITRTELGPRNTIFAPYGPKPISLGMCLYASLTNSPVYYTQPKAYNPQYCSGVKKNLIGVQETYAYCLRLDGKDFYHL